MKKEDNTAAALILTIIIAMPLFIVVIYDNMTTNFETGIITEMYIIYPEENTRDITYSPSYFFVIDNTTVTQVSLNTYSNHYVGNKFTYNADYAKNYTDYVKPDVDITNEQRYILNYAYIFTMFGFLGIIVCLLFLVYSISMS